MPRRAGGSTAAERVRLPVATPSRPAPTQTPRGNPVLAAPGSAPKQTPRGNPGRWQKGLKTPSSTQERRGASQDDPGGSLPWSERRGGGRGKIPVGRLRTGTLRPGTPRARSGHHTIRSAWRDLARTARSVTPFARRWSVVGVPRRWGDPERGLSARRWCGCIPCGSPGNVPGEPCAGPCGGVTSGGCAGVRSWLG